MSVMVGMGDYGLTDTLNKAKEVALEIETTKGAAQELLDQIGVIVFSPGSVTQMRTQVGVSGTRTELLGYYNPGDGGGGLFYWNANSTAADDGGTVIRPTAIPADAKGRYVRIWDRLNPRMFGAKGDDSVGDIDGIGKAIAAMPTTGGLIEIPIGRWAPIAQDAQKASLTKPNIQLIGQKRPFYNEDFTRLEGGSVVKGPLIYKAHNLGFFHLGVDSGAKVCEAHYSNEAQEGLVCSVTYLTTSDPQFKGLHVENVICLAKNPDATVHAFACEGYRNAEINHVRTAYGVHGQAYKVIDSQVSNCYSMGSKGNCFIIKSDAKRQTDSSQFTDLTASRLSKTSEAGITLESIQSDLNQPAQDFHDVKLVNPICTGHTYGLRIMCGSGGDNMRDITITGGSLNTNEKNGVLLTGKVRRITFIGTTANTNGVFGYETSPTGDQVTFIGCTASTNSSGFCSFGLNTNLIGCEGVDNTGWGFFAKTGSSCYISELRGSGNANGLFGSDTGVPFFSRDIPTTRAIPTLSGAWANYGGGNTLCGYYRDVRGNVFVSGLVKSGTGVIFTLPEGHRPKLIVRFPVATDTGYGEVYIDPSGNVTLGAKGGNGYVSLDGINFPTIF